MGEKRRKRVEPGEGAEVEKGGWFIGGLGLERGKYGGDKDGLKKRK